MATSRARLFLENFFVYGMASVLRKAIPFVMLPIITRLINDPSVFGKLDLYSLVISFGTPFVVLGMYDSMFRFSFDDSSICYRKTICSSALLVVLISGCIVLLIGVVASPLLARFIFGEPESRNLVYVALLVIFVSATESVVAAPTRIQNQRKIYLVMNIVVPVASYSISIPVIILGYPLTGLIAGSALSTFLSLVIFWHLNGKWFSVKHVHFERVKELLRFGIPLAPTFFIYWIFNACDRLMIVHMIGQDAVGMYGIGSRLAGVSALIYMAFSGGWQYFAFSTMKDSDHVLLISRTFQTLALLSFAATLLFIPAIRFFYPALVGQAYQEGAVVTPYLFLSPLLLMLSQILGTQLQIIKRPGLSTIVRFFCTFLNVGLNYWLIPLFGIEGAAIATVSSYALMTLLMALLAIRFSLLVFDPRFLIAIFSFTLLFATFKKVIWDNTLIGTLLATFWILAIIWWYRKNLSIIYESFEKVRG